MEVNKGIPLFCLMLGLNVQSTVDSRYVLPVFDVAMSHDNKIKWVDNLVFRHNQPIAAITRDGLRYNSNGIQITDEHKYHYHVIIVIF